MRVHYDGQNYFPPQGVGRYFRSIIERLPEDVVPSLAVSSLQVPGLPKHPHLERDVGWTVPSLRAYLRFPVFQRAVAVQLRRQGRRRPHDVAHPTYYELITDEPISTLTGPVVLTVYDMVHERFPELEPSGRVVAAKRAAIARADVVLCISEQTRADLHDNYQVADDRVVVTHLATDLAPAMAEGPEPVPPAPYLLYIGGRAVHKNFGSVLDALACLDRPDDPSLVVVGHPFTRAEAADVVQRGLSPRVQHVGPVDDAHLAKLYRHSLALLYPSLYEGFGIPLLEAMTCGTAVVAARTSSIPEVVGEAALLVDPTVPDELVDAVRLLLDDPGRRQALIRAGAVRAAGFSWDATAAATLDVYRQLAAGRPAGR